MLAVGLALVASVVAGVVGAPNPTEPSGSSVFNVGKECAIKWDADSTGSWKKMSIQLMTGDNWNMIPITTIAQDIDATDATKNTYTYTCPEVTPNSMIYFYQFSDPSDPKNLLWTTRWTLASADGQTTTPTETTQPNGDKIPWGKGALVDPSTAVPPPAYLSNNQGNSTATGSAVSSASVTSTVVITQSAQGGVASPVAGNPTVVTSSAAATSPVVGTTRAPAPSSSARAVTTGSTTPSANSTSAASTANGATTTAVSGFAMVGAFLAALGLF
ncbi:ser-thr-rich glycosyl-phosphatidyl-inositol-anchored membrane family protein [Rhizoctonia solani AG-3 Rhs1AP]|uniref:Ser-thr-rich glycosyl-phosphatidyl-inositol-anchored membrane family protein n=1 Tax=Rhizoctonia solani AG-3 Rhs1AP TaxID=1086054 RepID=X8J014_9AGAM|nr:ser-thr-rich glycosyl-phosphatidyl-inositol-anchored membrane family protein [Rhizoctonia solani AG-3 Rhs1AP]